MIITYVISVISAVEQHREIRNILFVGRVAAYEEPLLQEGLFERFSEGEPERFPLTNQAWQKSSTTETGTIKDKPDGAMA